MTRVLLDTHALLWWWTNDLRLSDAARSTIEDPRNEIFVSAASVWEIQIKQRLGKLPLMTDVTPFFDELMKESQFTPLEINWRHALVAGGYRQAHRDPFDRMLAAQSSIEDLPLVTQDSAFAAFGNACLW